MGACDCCDLVDDGAGIFKPLRQRWCTDIICLAFFIVYTAAMITIGSIALSSGNINYVLYPTDYLEQFCGNSPGVEYRTKAFYPRLNEDLKRQSWMISSGFGIVKFRPYTLCVTECPKSFSLESPRKYGGPNYPNALARKNESDFLEPKSFYTSFGTKEVFSRCLPVIDTQPALARQICAVPACDNADLISNLAPYQSVTCTTGANKIESTPNVDKAWVVTTPEGSDLCEFEVKEVNSQSFLPPGATPASRKLEREFADFVTNSFSVLRAITGSWREVLIMGLGAPFLIACIWFALLFLFAGLIVYFAILLLLAVLLALCVYFYIKAGWASAAAVSAAAGVDVSAQPTQSNTLLPSFISVNSPDDLDQTGYAVLAVIATIICGLYVVLVILWREKINRCIAIIRECTKVFRQLPLMVVYPLVGVVFYAGVFAYAFGIGAFIATSSTYSYAQFEKAMERGEANVTGVEDGGKVTIGDLALGPLQSLDQDWQMALFMAIHVVGCLWAFYIVQGAVYTTLARSSAVWYFSHGQDEEGKTVQQGTFFCGVRVVLASAWCIFSRHLGSIAFGAAIITVVQVVRFILEAIDYYTRDLQGSNLLLKIVIKCAKCALYCVEKTLRMITYYGYIFVAIEGDGFIPSCWKTVAFIGKYPIQIGINKMVAHMLSVVISLSIPLLCAFATFAWTDALERHKPIWPAIIVFFIAFLIASCITDVFRCTIDTIFICAFKDMEEHREEGPKFMSEDLREGFGIDTRDRKQTVYLREELGFGKSPSKAQQASAAVSDKL